MKREGKGPLTEAEVEESIRSADGVLASAGHAVEDTTADDANIRAALRGEITFDEAVERVTGGDE